MYYNLSIRFGFICFLSVYIHLCHLWHLLASCCFSLIIPSPSDALTYLFYLVSVVFQFHHAVLFTTFHNLIHYRRSLLLIDLYFCLPSLVCAAFHVCLSFTVSVISLVIHGLLGKVLCLRPTVSVATEVTVSLKSVQVTSGLFADLCSISFSSAKSTPVLNSNEE